MALESREVIIKVFLRDIKILLAEASGIAAVGYTLADAGATEQALQKMFDIEPLLHDARTLLSATVLQGRREREA
jgi:hypothetical protein